MYSIWIEGFVQAGITKKLRWTVTRERGEAVTEAVPCHTLLSD